MEHFGRDVYTVDDACGNQFTQAGANNAGAASDVENCQWAGCVDERRADRGNAFWVDILVALSEVSVIGGCPVAIQGSVVFWRFKRVGILEIDGWLVVVSHGLAPI